MSQSHEDGDVIVRLSRPDDFLQWLPLWEGYNAFYGRAGATAIDEETTADRWTAFQSHAVPMWALLACRGNQIVGLAHYVLHPSTTSLAPSCHLQDLFARREQRGRGVGMALIDGVASRARTEGCGSMYWQTHHTNVAAMGLYEKVAVRSDFVTYRLLLL